MAVVIGLWYYLFYINPEFSLSGTPISTPQKYIGLGLRMYIDLSFILI